MIRAVIFDMGGTLLRFRLPDTSTWRESEEPGIRGIYQYLVEQGHPLTAHEDAFVDVMFNRLAEGWEQSTGGHITLRAVDWIAAGANHHALTLDEAALLEAARRYAKPMRESLRVMPGVETTLATLQEQGYRIGLISNTIWPAELHLEDLAELGVLSYFEHTIFSGDAGVWKPHARSSSMRFRHSARPQMRQCSSATARARISLARRQSACGRCGSAIVISPWRCAAGCDCRRPAGFTAAAGAVERSRFVTAAVFRRVIFRFLITFCLASASYKQDASFQRQHDRRSAGGACARWRARAVQHACGTSLR